MARKPENEFTEATRRHLANRVGWVCSNPQCLRPTTAPHTLDGKSRVIGRAAHIHAASEGGARYEPNQTPEERRAASNGIWLCANHAADVDTDAQRFPADMLRTWKRDAEHDAQLRYDAWPGERNGNSLAERTQELLNSPRKLRDGTWIERSEINTIRSHLDAKEPRPIALLGLPGVGKSALLAELGHRLRDEGCTVVAIKADRLPRDIGSLADLGGYLRIDLPLNRLLYALGQKQRTVLLLDQLDALSDLTDNHTQRLSVLLYLISECLHLGNVRVVFSARSFDFKHDTRFEQLEATEVRLEPLPTADIERVLQARNVTLSKLPQKLRTLLGLPHWLGVFLSHVARGHTQSFDTEQALLAETWERAVLTPASEAQANDNLLTNIAREVSKREEFWIPRSALVAFEPQVRHFLSNGILAETEDHARAGFSHQLIYEYARARDLQREGTLVAYVRDKQSSLFVRPAIWTTLRHLRGTDPKAYRDAIGSLLADQTLRMHLRLLLLEFLGQLDNPDQFEEALFIPFLTEPQWVAACMKAAAGSRGWFSILEGGHLKLVMLGTQAGAAFPLLDQNLAPNREQVLNLVNACWSGKKDKAGETLAVLMRLNDWTSMARDLANEALSLLDNAGSAIETVCWHLKKVAPQFGIDLVVAHLERRLASIRDNLSFSVPVGDGASLVERMNWYDQREPHQTIDKLFREASAISAHIDLAQAAPEHFLRRMLPWLAAALELVASVASDENCYRKDDLIDCSRRRELVRELPHALRLAAEELAKSHPRVFLEILGNHKQTNLAALHAIFSYGLEHIATSDPRAVVAYLSEDPRRLCLGEQGHRNVRTVAILIAVSSHMTAAEVEGLEAKALASSIYAKSGDRPPRSRAAARDINRRHRFELLNVLPEHYLGEKTRSLLDRERRVFEVNADDEKHSSRAFGVVGSPMTAQQMNKASDDAIVHLFEVLPDSTEWQHPKRWLDGGSVQASGEFASLAKGDPARAVRIIQRLSAGTQERPVGYAIRSLADTDMPTIDLVTLIEASHERGFTLQQFRLDSANALENRAAKEHGLPDNAVQLLKTWLEQTPTGGRTLPREVTYWQSDPPFLIGWGGGGILPAGNYPILDALTVALLSAKPARADEWISSLERHLEVDEDPKVWIALLPKLPWLRQAPHARAVAFLDRLFGRYPECLEGREGVRLVQQASWWVDESIVKRWVEKIGTSNWKHAPYAHGELIAFLAMREPCADWAVDELRALLGSGASGDPRVTGAANSLGHMWIEPSTREATTALVCELAARGIPEIDSVLLDAMRNDDMVGDVLSCQVFRMFVERPVLLTAEQVPFAIEWAVEFMHREPKMVLELCGKIVEKSSAESDWAPRLLSAAEHLIKISVTLQRNGALREEGLTLFEKLLELNLYGIREVLDDVDALQEQEGS